VPAQGSIWPSVIRGKARMAFNTREMAVLIWAALILLFVLCYPSTRKASNGVLRAIIHKKILTLFGMALLYQAAIVWIIYKVGFWRTDLLKDTLLWIVTYSAVMPSRIILEKDPTLVIWRFLKDGVRAAVVIEYILNIHTFPLIAEVMLVFILGLLGTLLVVAERYPEPRVIPVLVSLIQASVVLAVLLASIRALSAEMADVFSISIIRPLALPTILTVAMIPMLYTTRLIIDYKGFFMRVDMYSTCPFRTRAYIRYRAIRYAGLSLRKVQFLREKVLMRLIHANDRHGVDEVFIRSEQDALESNSG